MKPEQVTWDNAPVNITHDGMASWAGFGPAGKTCRECVHYQPKSGSRYEFYPKSNVHANGLKPCICKRRKKMGHKPGAVFPHNALACKYFDQSDNPPPARCK